MSAKKAWLLYTILRVLFFVVPFIAVYLLLPKNTNGMNWQLLIAGVIATVIGFALSLLLLSNLREQAAQGVASWRDKQYPSKQSVADADYEDGIVDGAANAEDPAPTDPR